MARNRHSGAAQHLVDAVAVMPWWLGLTLAITSYLLLHALAIRPLPALGPGERPTAHVLDAVWRGLAGAGQYALPLLCVVGAGTSAFRRFERKKLLANAAGPQGAAMIDGLSWQDFEKLCSEGFRQRGYSVRERGGGGADGGVDLILERNGERFLVQCKHWRAQKVGVAIVRELYGVMAATGAAGGYVVTAGVFTDEARRFASGRNVELMDGQGLASLLTGAESPPQRATAASQAPSRLKKASKTR